MSDLTLVIPAYNEEKRIRSTLSSLNKVFGNKINILVVSNGSSDETINILENWGKAYKNLKYLDFPEKLGKGGAILEGLKVAKNKYIGYIDADDAFDLNYIKKIIGDLKKYDMVIASKWKGKSFFRVNEPFLRKFLSRGWNILVRFILGLKFRDTQAGAKFFRGEALMNIDRNFVCKNFAFDVELLWKLKEKGYSIKEVYVPTIHREGSTFKTIYVLYMFISLMKLWWLKCRKIYF
jgi:glycosyltransferase involved in cell wall biosynthesis|tara:strand:+ start:257 stop:964 length:708 start_codon:yes stop_codon:yes gene_type:complete